MAHLGYVDIYSQVPLGEGPVWDLTVRAAALVVSEDLGVWQSNKIQCQMKIRNAQNDGRVLVSGTIHS